MEKQIRAALVSLALVAAAVVLHGCVTSEPPPPILYAAGAAPRVAVLYYAYGPALNREIAQPIPNYDSWTDERMERDLARMERCGVDIVLLAFDVTEFKMSAARSRCRRFFDLAGSNSANAPKIAFWLYSSSTATGENDQAIARFSKWYVGDGVGRLPASYRERGRPLVIVAPALRALRAHHPALIFRRTTGVGADWTWESPEIPGTVKVSGDGRQALVVAGIKGRGVADKDASWALPRQAGKTFRRGLWAAFRRKSAMICVSSWNDFSRGDFIEPNSLDQDHAMTILREEVDRVKAVTQPVDIRPADSGGGILQ